MIRCHEAAFNVLATPIRTAKQLGLHFDSKILDIENGTFLKTFNYAHSVYNVNQLQQMESGELISCSEDTSIKIWDSEKEECVKKLIGHKHGVTSINIRHDKTLISTSTDGTIKFWSLKTGMCFYTIELRQRHPINNSILI